jgi:hypothetical protein
MMEGPKVAKSANLYLIMNWYLFATSRPSRMVVKGSWTATYVPFLSLWERGARGVRASKR